MARCDVAGWLHTLFRAAICDESLRRDFLLSMFLLLLLLILLLLSVNDIIIIINIFNAIVIIIERNKSCQHHTHVCMYTLLLLLLFRNTTAPTHLLTTHQSIATLILPTPLSIPSRAHHACAAEAAKQRSLRRALHLLKTHMQVQRMPLAPAMFPRAPYTCTPSQTLYWAALSRQNNKMLLTRRNHILKY